MPAASGGIMADSEGVDMMDTSMSRRSAEKSVSAEAPPEEPVVNLTPTNLDKIRASGTTPSAAAAAAAAAGAAPSLGPSPVPDDNDKIADLADRVAQLEDSISKGGAGADVQGILAQLQDLTTKVESLMAGMQGTVGYGARQTFVCSSCQNQGHVAAKLNCTVCGEDNWWGWWPPQKQ